MKRKSRAQLEYDLKIALEDYETMRKRRNEAWQERRDVEDRALAKYLRLESILIEDARDLGTYKRVNDWAGEYTDVDQYIEDRIAHAKDVAVAVEHIDRLDRLYPIVERPEDETND